MGVVGLMWISVAIMAQAVAGPVLPMPRKPATGRHCPPSDTGDEVVVCGRSAEAERLRPIPDYGAKDGLPRAATDIAGVGTLSGEVEQAGVGGFPSNRAMMRLKIPLGGASRK